MSTAETLLQQLDFITFKKKKWQNAPGIAKAEPALCFRPSKITELIDIVGYVRSFNQQPTTNSDNHKRVKVVGSGHSFSEVAKPRDQDVLVEMFRMNACKRYEAALKPGLIDRHFVKAQAGTRIKCLNKKLFKMGLALDNMGAFDWQTVSGALSTGTHGTGIKQPAFPDMVRAIILVDGEGKVKQIEPSDGITNKEDFARFEENFDLKLLERADDGTITYCGLIQDDKMFYSAVLGLGAMGIIYELVLEVSPKYWIKETRSVLDWDSELKPKLLNGYFKAMLEDRYDFVSFRVNPYKTFSRKHGKEVHLCALAVQKKYPWDQRPPERGLMARTKNWAGTILGNLKFISWIIVGWLNCFPGSTPGSIENAIRGSRDKLFIGRSYKVLYQTGISIRKYGISTENAFPYKDDFKDLIQLLEDAFQELDALRNNQDKKKRIYQSSHIPVRFVPESRAYLSPCNTGAKIFVDFPTLDGVKGYKDILIHNQEFCLRKGGIPHWGKRNECMCEDRFKRSNPDFLGNHYPQVEIWKESRRKLDPDGIFLSDFVKAMGLE